MKKKDHEVNLSDEDAAYAGLIAGSSDSDSDNVSISSMEEANNVEDPNHKKAIKEHKRKKIEEMRKKLLGNLANDTGDSYGKNKRRDNNYDSDGDQQSEDEL